MKSKLNNLANLVRTCALSAMIFIGTVQPCSAARPDADTYQSAMSDIGTLVELIKAQPLAPGLAADVTPSGLPVLFTSTAQSAAEKCNGRPTRRTERDLST